MDINTLIQSPRLIIRCYHLSDAQDLLTATQESIENLKVWMPWARNGSGNLQEKQELIQGWRDKYRTNEDFVLGVFTINGEFIGGTGFHKRLGPGVIEIGYWMRTSAQRKGYMSETVRAITAYAFQNLNPTEIVIKCDSDNIASAGVAVKAGYPLISDAIEPEVGHPCERLKTKTYILNKKEFVNWYKKYNDII